MQEINKILENNKRWVQSRIEQDPSYFKNMADQQNPAYFWIGCADSRAPESHLVNLGPGNIFVHRNVANLAQHTDMNLLTALQYGIHALKIKHIIICGHYGCGGVMAAYQKKSHGFADHWLRPIKDTAQNNHQLLQGISCEHERLNKLIELNVVQQVQNVSQSSIVQQAWANNQELHIHGLVYDLKTGLLKNLDCTLSEKESVPELYQLEF